MEESEIPKAYHSHTKDNLYFLLSTALVVSRLLLHVHLQFVQKATREHVAYCILK